MCADYDVKEVQVRHLGYHSSSVATKILQKGDTYVLGPMGWLELIQGHFRYHVHFGEEMPLHGTENIEALKNESDTTGHVNQGQNHSDDSECCDQPPRKKLKADSTSIQKTLHSFVNKDSESSSEVCKLDLSPTWREVDTLLVLQYGPSISCSKVASFDLDNTIIETASGRKFATGPTDWKFVTRVTDKLKSLSKEGYKIVLLTNQLGISKGKPTKDEFKQKMEAIAVILQIPLLVMASTTKDVYRKPCIGMWDHLEKFENGKSEVDMKSSFYVGDAAGRNDKWMPGVCV